MVDIKDSLERPMKDVWGGKGRPGPQKSKAPVTASDRQRRLRATLDRLRGERTLTRLAQEVDVDLSYLSRIWAGQRIPSLEVALVLARVLGISMEVLTLVLLGLDVKAELLKTAEKAA